ncbi:hypothetical protein NC651_030501 [Populus alba x Populus x berolinensis]|nr:hypothetical protein NC651_030501 [Populus alba x Populus x berolinensis]
MSYCWVDRACVTSAADIQKQWFFRLIGSDFCEDRSRLIFEEAVLQRLGEWQLRGVAIMKA